MHLWTLPLTLTTALAWSPPTYPNWQTLWFDSFTGPSGTLPDQSKWNILDRYLNVNNEHQTYVANPHEVQLSGGSTLQLVPWRNASVSPRGWSSGRIESTFTFTPQPGTRTMAEGLIRFGSHPISAKQGIWPAFWLLGDSIRHGTGWPACGELDILETVNGELTGHGTIHCGVFPGGVCNEPLGRGGKVGIPDQEWQRWRIVWDRTGAGWEGESVAWYMNEQLFHRVVGAEIWDAAVWAGLAQRPLFFILNVAVGGDWPGPPNGDTRDGYGSMMEVAYVALYSERWAREDL
ncbi:concanavalin A-like lectin/glucanase domain-containing protein [Podospora aff. communis PSN243]|uniref:Concanavalin A-like lectin/glucanase domain-containing protein n=1 Tax=Podospora aff. communis PSN243 TaxID=3040156 RepID=A0AAV9GH90_9PEZI|nr:concanavalin A-like lectin/glucanase domain-containing protein [Podospora aff. communis PSN243]